MSQLRRRGFGADGGVDPLLPSNADQSALGVSASSQFNRSTPGGATGGRWRRWLPVAAVAVYLSVAFALIWRLHHRLPVPGPLEHGARAHLRRLLALGPRVGGSYENEVLAVQVLLDAVANISEEVAPHLAIETDHQVVSGSFDLDLLDGVASEYAHVQNVVVRLSPIPASEHSVLVNCHFDSVSNSPGASDDAVSCAVMLQLLSLMSHRATARQLRHNIIFLFNGAEENMMQASHGFITKHKWAWSVRAHINLEACGAGGREVVFQTGPGHSWLVKAYADVAPHPFAHILAQEIFQSGIIPADTDFRIFRDYGKVPGLDMAFYANGYVYHTPFDNEHQISAGSVQRAGENVLAMLYRLATTDDIIEATRQEASAVVFADFLGLFMYVCPGWLHRLICYCTALATYVTVAAALRRHGFGRAHLMVGIAVFMFACICSLCTVASIALYLDYTGHALSWYSHNWVALCVYAAPALAVLLAVQHALYARIYPDLSMCRVRLEALVYETQRSLLVLPLLLSAYLNIYSGFLLLFMLALPTLIRSLIAEHWLNCYSGWTHVLVYLASQTIPMCLSIHYALTSLEMFIPLLGRCGSAIHADLALALIVLLSTIAVFWYLMSVLMLSPRVGHLASALLLFGALVLIAVSTTQMALPYNADRPHPRSHRVVLQHVVRRVHSVDGAVVSSDSGVMVNYMDRNSGATLRRRWPNRQHATASASATAATGTVTDLSQQCVSQLYCGVPYYYPIRKIAYNGVYMSGPAPVVTLPVRVTVSRQTVDLHTVRLHLNISGPDHVTVQVCARPGVALVAWSVGAGVPRSRSVAFQGRDTYFLYYAYGLRAEPWRLWLDLQTTDLHADGDYLLDANVNGHYLHGSGVNASYLSHLAGQLPAWTIVTRFTSTLDALKL